MNLTIFNKREADEVTTKLRKLLQYKIGFTNMLPNILLNNKEIFNLINLYNRQKEKQITELELKLNDKHGLGITMESGINNYKRKSICTTICLKYEITIIYKYVQRIGISANIM